MTPRTLKKLSKRVAPWLALFDKREQFPAKRGECYAGIQFSGERREYMPCVLKGTPMIGGMAGYEQPEWYEETTWEAAMHVLLMSRDFDENTGTFPCIPLTTRERLHAFERLAMAELVRQAVEQAAKRATDTVARWFDRKLLSACYGVATLNDTIDVKVP